MGFRRAVRNFLKGRIHGVFEFGQRFGVDIVPRHFYSSTPNIGHLKRDRFWKQPRSMAGVAGADVDEQLVFVRDTCQGLQTRMGSSSIHAAAAQRNGESGYGAIEADFLFAFITKFKPRRVVQVGAGVSTAVIQLAASEGGFDIELICIDPFPTEFLRRESQAGRIKLIAEKAQKVPLETLVDVGEPGMLFVDSTHTIKPDSEVNRIVLEVLPRLARGSWVHFHDITFPYDYQPALLTEDLFFSNETPLLHAFLACNSRYRIAASLSMLAHARADQLREILPNYRPRKMDDGLNADDHDPSTDFPSAVYLQAVA